MIKTFKDYGKEEDIDIDDLELLLGERTVLKSPVILFGLLYKMYGNIKSTRDEKEMIKNLAKMTWINGQMTYSYIREIENKIDAIMKEVNKK